MFSHLHPRTFEGLKEEAIHCYLNFSLPQSKIVNLIPPHCFNCQERSDYYSFIAENHCDPVRDTLFPNFGLSFCFFFVLGFRNERFDNCCCIGNLFEAGHVERWSSKVVNDIFCQISGAVILFRTF